MKILGPIIIRKIWQNKNNDFHFKISNFEPKQFKFLKINSNNSKYPIIFSEKRFSDAQNNKTATEILRKHLIGSYLVNIFSKFDSKEFYLIFQSSNTNEYYYFKLSYQKKFEIELVSPKNISLLRINTKGTFTHKKKNENILTIWKDKSIKDLLHKKNLLLEINQKDSIETKKINTEKDFSPFQKEAQKKLKRRLKLLEKTMQKLKLVQTNEEAIRINFLKINEFENNLHKIRKGDNIFKGSIIIDEKQKEFTFELDTKLSPGENLNRFYKQNNKKKKSISHIQEQISHIEINKKKIRKEQEKLESSLLSQKEIISIYKNLNIPSPQNNDSISKKKDQKENFKKFYKVFIDKEKVHYLVGKDASDNDKLVKMAKSNDLWFHAAGTKGAHVIIPRKSITKKEKLSKYIKIAGILAVYYSKQKSTLSGEVYFTERSNLSKKKNSPPGLWEIKKSSTIHIKYSAEELKAILNMMNT